MLQLVAASSASSCADTLSDSETDTVPMDTEEDQDQIRTKDASTQYDPPPPVKTKGRTIGVQVTTLKLGPLTKKKTWSRGITL